MEKLLNKLIEKGFRPFWKKAEHCLWCRYNNDWSEMYKYVGFVWWDDVVADRKVPLRSLASIDSWLWQFVCENMLINKKWFYWDEYCVVEHCEYTPKHYEYRLIESALKDESELEDFLLDNIKIDE